VTPAGRAVLALSLVLAALAHGAEEEQRFDHRGALGLLVGGGIDFKREVKSGGETEEGRRALLETLVTFPMGVSGNEWTVGARTGFGGDSVDVASPAAFAPTSARSASRPTSAPRSRCTSRPT